MPRDPHTQWIIDRLRRIPVQLTPEEIAEQEAIDARNEARRVLRHEHHPLIDGELYGLEPVLDDDDSTAPKGAKPTGVHKWEHLKSRPQRPHGPLTAISGSATTSARADRSRHTSRCARPPRR